MTDRRVPASANRKGNGRALQLLAGTWRTDGQLVGVASGPKSKMAAVDRYEWVPGLNLLAHYVSGHLGPTSVSSFEVWAYDARRRAYVSTSFDEKGAPSTFEGRLRGLAWTILGKTERFSGTFSKDTLTLEGTWDQKSKGTWSPWLTITLRKVGG